MWYMFIPIQYIQGNSLLFSDLDKKKLTKTKFLEDFHYPFLNRYYMKMDSTIDVSSVKPIPVYPGLQRHTKLFKPSSHVAPFIQGLSLQSS